jgi:hypothetical protein
MTIIWYIAIALGCALVVCFFVYLKRKQDELEAGFQQRFSGKNIRLVDKNALFVAQESDGYSHFRGIGYLVLTDDELYFKRQLINKVIQVPISSIKNVRETYSLGGQNLGKLMLRIDFDDSSGKNDSMALRVKELKRWKKAIADMINKKA